MTTITNSVAAKLARHKGALELDGLTDLSEFAAETLARHEGNVSLNGLTHLSDAAAGALAGHKGHLSLNGLWDLSDAGAAALARHRGSMYFDELPNFDWPGYVALEISCCSQQGEDPNWDDDDPRWNVLFGRNNDDEKVTNESDERDGEDETAGGP